MRAREPREWLGFFAPRARLFVSLVFRSEIASAVPERLGCCHGPAQAQGQYAQWARKHLHRESLREVSRCRHAALDRLLLRPTETYAGDPDHCRMMDDSPNDPGVANAWDSSDARGAYEDRPPRAA